MTQREVDMKNRREFVRGILLAIVPLLGFNAMILMNPVTRYFDVMAGIFLAIFIYEIFEFASSREGEQCS